MDRLIFFLKVQNNTPDFVPFNEGNIFPLYTHRRSDNTVREKYFCKYSFLLDQNSVSKPRSDLRAYQFNNQNNSDNIIERLNKCNTLGEKIKELRLYHHISAREMYTYLNIHKSTLQDYENDCEFNDDFHIECFIDISRKDNINPCKHKKITLDILKHHNYLDIDQSRYINDKKYYVVDLFKLGKLNKNQRNQLEHLFIDLNDRKLHNRSATIYYTDEDEFGLWDYLKAEPYKNF